MTNPLDLPGIAALLGDGRGLAEFVEPNEYDDQSYFPREVRVLIKLALLENDSRLRDEFRSALIDLRKDLEQKFEQKLSALQASAPTPVSVQEKGGLPSYESLTKLKVQFFDNRHKSKAERRGQALFQLKVYAWTCAADQTARYPTGNHGYWLVPLHRPGAIDGRKRIPELMSFIDELGRDYVKQAGSVQFNKRKIVSQFFYLSPDDRLMLSLEGEMVDLGLPRTRADDHGEDAAIRSWIWPDRFAD